MCENLPTKGETESADSDGSDDESPDLVDPADLTLSNITTACFHLFSRYLRKNDGPCKSWSLSALSGLFISQPRLLFQLERSGLIGEVMGTDAPVSLQVEALASWRRILVAEEKRVDGGKAQEEMETDGKMTLSKRVSGDQNGDATLFGGVLTSHADRLFQLTQSPEHLVRRATINLIEVLLRQGLLNPNDTIPYLFALQGDIEDKYTRSKALTLLMTEGDKRPDLLRQRIVAGVKRAYEFQALVYPRHTKPTAVVPVESGRKLECLFASVYQECIASSRKQREGLFKNLLSLFQSRSGSTKSSRSKTTDSGLLSFASQILAFLPYTAPSDPLFIIYHITSMTTLSGERILDDFAKLLRPVGLASEDELDETNLSEDVLEKAARSKFPSRTLEAKALMSGAFDSASFAKCCNAALSVVLLLRLKGYLCKAFHISEIRCLEYDPNNKDKVGDKLPSRDVSHQFDATVPNNMKRKDGSVDVDVCIRQYAEFRRLMREESAADVDEPVKSRKRSFDDMDNE